MTLPSCRNAGASVASTSAVVPGRRQPSSATSPPAVADRRDLGVEAALRLRLGRPCAATRRRTPPGARGDAEALGDLLGGLAHCEVELRVGRGQAGVGHVAGAALRHARHRLHARRDVRLAHPERERAGGRVHGLHRRAAEAVDGRSGDGAGESREHARDAPEVHALLALREGAADRDVLDRRAVDAAALDEGAHDLPAQLVGAHVHELALARRLERRAHVAGDHRPHRHSARSVQRRVSAWIARQWRRRTIGRKSVNQAIIPAGIRKISVAGLSCQHDQQADQEEAAEREPAVAPVAAIERADRLVVGSGDLLASTRRARTRRRTRRRRPACAARRSRR